MTTTTTMGLRACFGALIDMVEACRNAVSGEVEGAASKRMLAMLLAGGYSTPGYHAAFTRISGLLDTGDPSADVVNRLIAMYGEKPWCKL